MGDDGNAFGELIQDYIIECLPLAEQVGDAFLELERRWREGDAGDDVLEPVKGRLHTVKGNSAMMGLAPMQAVAHALEDVCALLAAEPRLRGEEAAALLVEGSGLLIDSIRSAADGSRPEAADLFVEQVRMFLAASENALARVGSKPRHRNAVRVNAVAQTGRAGKRRGVWCGSIFGGSMPCSRWSARG